MYGCSIWSLKCKAINKMDDAQNKLLDRIFGRRDRYRRNGETVFGFHLPLPR